MSAFTVARLGPSWLCQPLMFTAGRTAAMLVLFACMAGPAPAHAPRRTGSLDLKAIVQAAQREGGGAPAVTQALLRDWPLKGSEFDKVLRVHRFFHEHLSFASDQDVWHMRDYWAPPLQFFSQRQGDCEDFALGKYVVLLSAGVPADRLRAVYVSVRSRAPQDDLHIVLAYYPAGLSGEPFIIDNLTPLIQPASERTDLAMLEIVDIHQDDALHARTGLSGRTKWLGTQMGHYAQASREEGFVF